MTKLRVKAIFTSADGEANGWNGPGEITTFIRLQGCSLGCKFCDTFQAQDPKGGTIFGIGELHDKVMDEHPQKLTITGGEPLEQREGVKDFIHMMDRLHSLSRITLETNGVHDVDPFVYYKNVSVVMDYKPDSMCNLTGGQQEMRKRNRGKLDHKDLLKCIICNKEDYDKAVRLVPSQLFNSQVAFSPLHGVLDPQELVEWMIEDTEKIKGVRLSVQLHKYIWPHCIDTEIEV